MSPAARAAAWCAAVVLVAAAAGFLVTRSAPGPRLTPTPPPGPTVTPTGPVTALEYSVADYPPQNEVVVFGGIDSYDRTWLWRSGHWSAADPASSPPGRLAAAIAYDPQTQLTMLYGGRLGSGQVVNDTWGWDGSNWRELDSGTGAPPMGEGGAMAWDPSLQAMVMVHPVFGLGAPAQTWLWAGSHWERLSSADFASGLQPIGLVYDAAANRLLAFAAPGDSVSAAIETLVLSGNRWTLLAGSQPYSFAGVVFSPASDAVLLAGPSNRSGSGTETWTLTAAGWRDLGQASQPLDAEGMATDASGRAVLFGTSMAANQVTPQPLQAWLSEGSSWTQYLAVPVQG